MQNEKTPEKIIEDNQHLTNYNVARKNKNYLSILKTYNNQDGEFRCIDQYPGQLGDEGAMFKWFKYKFLPGGKFAQRAVLYVDGDESFTKRGIEKVIGEEVAMERALDYPFYNKFDAIDRFVKNNSIITDGEAQIIDQDEDGFASWIISKEPLKEGFLIVANYKAPTEKIEGEIVEGKPVTDKKVLLPGDYSITGEYKFDGTDFVKEKYNGDSELHFDELANGEFKIYSTRKV